MIWNGNYDILKLNYEFILKWKAIYLYKRFEEYKFLKEKYYFEIVSKCLKYLRKFYMLYENIWTISEKYRSIFLDFMIMDILK